MIQVQSLVCVERSRASCLIACLKLSSRLAQRLRRARLLSGYVADNLVIAVNLVAALHRHQSDIRDCHIAVRRGFVAEPDVLACIRAGIQLIRHHIALFFKPLFGYVFSFSIRYIKLNVLYVDLFFCRLRKHLNGSNKANA